MIHLINPEKKAGKTLASSLLFLFIFFATSLVIGQTAVEITTLGAGTWTVPAGVSTITVECWGGGGGGGAARTTDGAAAGGGGGGAYSRKIINIPSGTTSINYNVGAGGKNGAGQNGTSGQDSWFRTNTTLLAKGGRVAFNVTTNTSGVGGAGGDANLCIGDVKYSGGAGANGNNGVLSTNHGGGAGAGANSSGAGNPGSGSSGGIGVAPGGNGGNGGINNTIGAGGVVYGGGGGGAHKRPQNRNGGVGAQGVIRIIYPTITSFSPNAICAGSASEVTITGTNLANATEVSIGGFTLNAPFVSNTATEIKVNVPSGTANSAPVVVTTNLGKVSSTSLFTINPLPDLSDLTTLASPTAPGSGSTVTIRSSSLQTGDYIITYDLEGDNQWLNQTASISFTAGSPGIASFITRALLNEGTNTLITITSIQNSNTSCISSVSSNNSAIIVVTSQKCPSFTSLTPIATQAGCTGFSANELTAEITTTGTEGVEPTFSYQWYYNNTNSNIIAGATKVEGATSSTFTPSTGESEIGSRYYFCVGYAGDNDCNQTDATQGIVSNTVPVLVTDAPSAPIAESNEPVCEGSTLNLTASDLANGVYSWRGPDGFTSSLQNPSISNVSFDAEGDYFVTVSLFNCPSDEAMVSVTVKTKPSLPVVNNNGPICEGEDIELTVADMSDVTYTWSGPDGFSSNDQNPVITNVTLSQEGLYTATVIAQNACTASSTTTVDVKPKPSEPFINNEGPKCVGQATELSTEPVDGATFSWGGPNNFSAAGDIVEFSSLTSSQGGEYFLVLTVNGCNSDTATTDLVVNSLPSSLTVTSNSPVCVGNTINLFVNNVGGASYSWTGPNGFTSLVQNPSISDVTTAAAGNYNVTVTVAACVGSISDLVNVTINSTLPSAPTASNNGPVCQGSTVTLGASDVTGASYNWTGPDGFTSLDQNPTTTVAGTYSVTATVNGCSSSASNTTVEIKAVPDAPTASNNGPVCQGSTVNLGASDVTDATYSWTGPGGFTSGVQNPTTTVAGAYLVTATVNGCTSAASSTTVVINAIPNAPTASNNGPACQGSTVTLGASNITGASYNWTGPGGFTSVVQNPTTTVAGTYSVTATVNGCTSSASNTTVEIKAIPNAPSASNNGPACEGSTITLGASTITGASYNWTGPGGFTSDVQNPTSTVAGTYSVTATVNGCASSASNTTVEIKPLPEAPVASNNGPACDGSTITLNASTITGASYNWTGPNGFTSSNQNTTTTVAGTYSVTATVNGCASTASSTTIVNNAIPSSPTASNNGPACEGSTVTLDASTITGASYNWTGPNGFTSAVQSPTTAVAGTYSVTATVNGCTSAASSTTVVFNTLPTAPTASNNGPVCEGSTINLSASTITGATYSWTGPNGFTSSNQNTTTTVAGTYSVTATVNGCASAASSTTVVFNTLPTAPTASNNGPVCEGSTVNLSASTITGATYSWTGPNGFTSSNQNTTTTVAGTYSVTATVNGCTSAAGSTTVVINNTPTAPTASNDGPACEGSIATLEASDIAGATYSWTGPNGFTSNDQNPTVTEAGTYSVIATVNGCASTAVSTTVLFNALPTAPIASNNGPVCEGSTVNLSASNITGATYSWTGPNGFTSSNQNTTTTVAGTYSVTATVNGCTSEVSETTVVIVAGQLLVSIAADHATCFGSDNGSLTATINGGSGDFSYVWTTIPVQTTATASGLEAGTYSVTVTDNTAGCSVTISGTVSEPTALEVDVTVTDATCITCTDGSVTITVTGGTDPYEYEWSNQQTESTITDLLPGDYTVTITDANGCTLVEVVEVGYNVSVNEYSGGFKSVNIYPNPANAVINYSATIEGKELVVQLVDVQGRIISTATHTSFNGVVTSTVNTSVLNPGIYQLRFISEKGVSNKKFIVAH
jgi:hypothetical protein